MAWCRRSEPSSEQCPGGYGAIVAGVHSVGGIDGFAPVALNFFSQYSVLNRIRDVPHGTKWRLAQGRLGNHRVVHLDTCELREITGSVRNDERVRRHERRVRSRQVIDGRHARAHVQITRIERGERITRAIETVELCPDRLEI